MKILLLLLVVTLSGCSAIDSVIDKGAEANDAALTAAEFTICEGASVGSIRRKYNTPDRVKVWQELCGNVSAFSPSGEGADNGRN